MCKWWEYTVLFPVIWKQEMVKYQMKEKKECYLKSETLFLDRNVKIEKLEWKIRYERNNKYCNK